MIWRRFLKPAAPPIDESWWRQADALAVTPTAEHIDALAATARNGPADDAERQDEMIEGLRQLLEVLANGGPPVVTTQHRVIGSDTCHWVAPVSLAGDVGVPGKLFVTSARLVLSAGRVTAWPWHRVSRLTREGRSLIVAVAGAEGLVVHCNTYGDALVVAHLADRVAR